MLIWIAVWLTAHNEVIVPFLAEKDAKAFVETQPNAEDYTIWRTMLNNPDYELTAYQWKAITAE